MVSMKEIFWVTHHLHGLLVMDMEKWPRFYSGGKRSIRTSQLVAAKHHSKVQLGVGIGWR